MFGIECYVSEHEGFKGNIKISPEDFKVTEISKEGKLASLTGTKIDPSPKLGIKVTLEDQSKPIASAIDSASVHLQTGPRTSLCISDPKSNIGSSTSQESNVEASREDSIIKDHRKCLSDVLDNDTLTELENFASNELQFLHVSDTDEGTKTNAADSCKVIAAPNEASLSLGFISSKESRTVVHKSVKYLYPHLRTKICKVPDKEGVEIQISREPVIVEFQDLQIPVPQILAFVRFLETRDHEQTFCFERLESKDRRTRLHRLIAKHYGTFVETKTFGDGSSEFQKIVVRFRSTKGGKKRKGGEMHHLVNSRYEVITGFTLQKTNTETLSAIQQLARLVGVHPSDFSYAGIKDKKAVTTQEMALKGVTIQRLQHACKQLPAWLRIGSVHSRNRPLTVGELWGNHFDIEVQNVAMKDRTSTDKQRTVQDAEKELQACIEQCIGCVEDKGFINYFGEQRFGASSDDPGKAKTSISPADIGRAMLQGKYKEAVDLILSPDNGPCADSSDPSNVAKLTFQETGSSREALKQMPAMKTRECLLLKGLNRHGTDDDGCTKALMNIPHNMRQMYIHAFCSLIWNQMASWRMRCYGYQVQEGDLVCTGDLETKVHVVTGDDITQGKYSIMEVMLPLPGNNIQYPSHTAGAEYQRRLDEAGLGGCNFRVPALKLNIPGGYRKVIALPRNLEWGWGICEDSKTVAEDDEGHHTEDTEDTWLPGNSAADSMGIVIDAKGSSGVVSAGCPNPSEASRRHVEWGCQESDRDPAVGYRDFAREGSVVRPQEGSVCASECHVASKIAGIKDGITAYSQDDALSMSTTNTTGGPDAARSPSHHHNDICQSLCHSREDGMHCNENQSPSKMSHRKKTLKLSFDLPASSYATVFLRELMKT